MGIQDSPELFRAIPSLRISRADGVRLQEQRTETAVDLRDAREPEVVHEVAFAERLDAVERRVRPLPHEWDMWRVTKRSPHCGQVHSGGFGLPVKAPPQVTPLDERCARVQEQPGAVRPLLELDPASEGRYERAERAREEQQKGHEAVHADPAPARAPRQP